MRLSSSLARPPILQSHQAEREGSIFANLALFRSTCRVIRSQNDDPRDGGAGDVAGCQAKTIDASSDSGPTTEIEVLYASFIKEIPGVEGEGHGGGKYVSGLILNNHQEGEKIALHFRRKQAGDNAKLASYFNYLYGCIRFVNGMVSHLSTSRTDFRPSISVSITALGELCDMTLLVIAQSLAIPHGVSGIWGTHYLKSGGEVEAKMLQQRWCKSDIERIRQSFNGLATRHFLSHLEKSPAQKYNHDACGLQMCKAGQIYSKTYTLTHTPNCGGCEIIGVDQQEVKDVLTDTDNDFPVLRLDLDDSSGDRAVNFHVEAYAKDKPYIALSHVRAPFSAVHVSSLSMVTKRRCGPMA